MEKQVTRLSPKPRLERKKRVAAYARVSTEKDAMLRSLTQQVSYYSNLIQREPSWTFAGVYADEACTGTKDARPEFQRLLSDCRKGAVDMVITKSISRFARNTVTLLETVRELKDLNIDVFFEEQQIHTMSSDGELMLTILASYAQEESRSVSDNQKWRIRKSFAEGDLMCLSVMFGYRVNKGIEIDPEQASIVREIYDRVVHGESLNSIAQWLNRSAVHGPLGGKWKAARIRSLVSNEKYAGNALLQKTFVNNHLDKKLVSNLGELPQYYATETHPAIIDQQTFDDAQEALARIAKRPVRNQKQHFIFSGIIVCAACGNHYKRVLNHGASRWVCPTYNLYGKAFCQSRKIPEETLIRVCCEVFQWTNFDEQLLRDTIDRISVVYPNSLVFRLKDGTERKAEWQHESRSKSWTPEMKAQAAEAARKRHHGQESMIGEETHG